MTKQEIIEQQPRRWINDDIWAGTWAMTHDSVDILMDEYAKQQCIGFAEWASVNGWYFNKIKRWSNRNESSENLIEVLSATRTTEELYQLFLTETSI